LASPTPSIHAELHRRFKEELQPDPVEQYGAVLALLEEWDEAMEGGSPDM
jgi:hypothetical protein